MLPPAKLNIPALYAGDGALISWDAVPGAAGYILERRFDATFDNLKFDWDEYERMFPSWDIFEAELLTWDERDSLEPSFAIYAGPDAQYTDSIAQDASTAVYRVRAIAGADRSSWTVSPVTAISIEPRPPVIDGEDGNIGTRYGGFSVEFSVYDPDQNSAVNVAARLDGEEIASWESIAQHTQHFVEIVEDRIAAMEWESTHTIAITATDDTGLTSTRTYTFRVVEDIVTDAVYYILRDDKPVARIAGVFEWADYMEVGTHKYVVRAVDKYDNFADSNAVTITTTVNHATLARAANPSDYLEIKLRLDERPRKSQSYSIPANEMYFEGREYPVYGIGPQRSRKHEIDFTTRTIAEWSMLLDIINGGEPVIYRDLYGTRIPGFVPQLSPEFMRRMPARPQFESVINHTLTINQIDYREVIQYD